MHFQTYTALGSLSFRCDSVLPRSMLGAGSLPALIILERYMLTKFVDTKIKTLLEELNINHHFTSVEHPQTNGLLQSANRVLLRGLKRKGNLVRGNTSCLKGVSHHTALNHMRNSYLAHLWN